MFATLLIKEINSLFARGIINKENPIIIDESISRLMFCYHSMIYTALNLNNNFCWDCTSYRWNESEVSSSKSSLERIALILVCRLLSADKISHHRSVKNSLNCLFFFRWTHTAGRGSRWYWLIQLSASSPRYWSDKFSMLSSCYNLPFFPWKTVFF